MLTPPYPHVAIVGVSALFPGSLTAGRFWQNILEGHDLFSEVPASHWLIEDYYDPDPATPDKTYAKRGGFLPKTAFSPMAFGVPPNIVPATDTAQLLALGVAKRVLEDAAGGDFSGLDRDKISVVLGVASATELVGHMSGRLQQPVWERALGNIGLDPEQVAAFGEEIARSYVPWQESTFPGLLGNVVAGRIANRLDLGGTNCVIDAACASSFAALELGLNELYLGQSDLVISGGVDTLNDILMYMCFSRTTALSPSGDCRPFSDQADGTMLGEGIGMVAMKRLEDAERDGDTVYAVIRALGSSSDGRAKSIYAPVSKGQAKAIARAYERAGYSPDTVELLEAHGTGTKAGDAAEFGGMKIVFEDADADRTQWCALGSVKSQIGHTKASAGAAGLFKVAMALHHKVLPPTIKVERPNPLLDLEHSPFYLNTETRPWIRDGAHPRRASVSSFGFGGTNFHIALEEYQGPHKAKRLRALGTELFLWSASDADALTQALSGLPTPLPEGREAFQWHAWRSQQDFDPALPLRAALVARGGDDLADKVAALLRHLQQDPTLSFETPQGVFYSPKAAPEGGVAFLFPGQGSQYVAMGAQMAIHFDAARAIWDQAASMDWSDLGQAPHKVVYPLPVFDDQTRQTHHDTLTQTQWAQPAIGLASAATLAMLTNLGLKPAAVAGHSYGEVTALHAAGVLGMEDFVHVSRTRGQLMAKAAEDAQGAMTAVVSTLEDLEGLLTSWKVKDVVVANHNSPSQVVLSGATEAIASVEEKLGTQGVKFKRLSVATAFHSPIVSDSTQPFLKALGACTFKKPGLEVYANTTASPYPKSSKAIKSRLAEQIANPVRFVAQIQAMRAAGVHTFLEVGPESVLTGLVRRILATEEDWSAVATDRRGKDGVEMFQTALAQLSVLGHRLDLAALWQGYATPQDPATLPVDTFSLELDGANYDKPSPFREPSDRAKAAAKALKAPAAAPPTPKPLTRTTLPQSPAPAPVPASTPAPIALSSPQPPHAQPMKTPTPPPLAQTHGSSPPNGSSRPPSPDTSLALLEAFERMQHDTARAQSEYQRLMAHSHTAFLQMAQNSFEQIAAVLTGSPSTPAPRLTATTLPELPPAAPARLATDTSLSHSPLTQSTASLRSNGTAAPLLGGSNGSNGSNGHALTPLFAAPAAFPAPSHTPQAVTRPPAQAPASPPAPVAAMAPVPQQAPSQDLNRIMLEVVSEKTGYPTEMLELSMELEADLGIDSIKRVEILSAMQERVPSLPEVETSKMAALRTLAEVAQAFGLRQAPSAKAQSVAQHATPTPAASGAKTSQAPQADLVAIMLEVVSEKTGYPTEMLELSMELEADLGIDSIKRVEILSAMQERVPSLPEVETSKMAALRTLQEIVDALGGPAASQTPQGASAPSDAQAGAGTDLVAVMLEVVSDKTGYPTEMLELSMELEADLGIDSIKRVEILSAMQERVPSLPEVETSKMAALRTLQEIVDTLGGALSGKPEAHQGRVAEAAALVSDPDPVARYSVTLLQSPAKGLIAPALAAATSLAILAPQEAKLGAELAKLLKKEGKKVTVLATETTVPDDVDGIVFLGALTGSPTFATARTVAQHAFEVVSGVAERFLDAPDHLLVTVQNTGGDFGRSATLAQGWHGGLAGLTKTARQEGFAHIKAIDLAPGPRESVKKLAKRLHEELWQGGADLEVGLSQQGVRVVPTSIAAPASEPVSGRVDASSVVVVSGGARGVTAACVIELARHTGATFVLLGRSALGEEPAVFHGLSEDADLKRAALTEAKDTGQSPSPKELGWRVSAVKANREIRETLDAITQAGGQARYVSVDVRDEAALNDAFDVVRAQWGPITGLVHGAGVLADALLSKKTPEQFATVYDTKVDGLDALLRATEKDTLQMICLFSSVAARTGNAGQSDYAMANDVLNRVGWALAAARPGCLVKSLGWGPWAGGMVTPTLRELFRRRGVSLIEVDAGAKAFVHEVLDANQREVEVVLGGGVLTGSFESQLQDDAPFAQLALISPATMPMLQDHKVQGKVVFPLVAAAELFLRAAQVAHPSPAPFSLLNLRVLKGLVWDAFDTNAPHPLTLSLSPAGDRTQAGVLDALLLDAQGTPRVGATVTPSNGRPEGAVAPALDSLPEPPWDSTAKLYAKDTLFHGPSFQVIAALQGLGEQGARATLVGLREKGWEGTWRLDAALVDGCLQVALLWGLKVCGAQTLPLKIASLTAYAPPAAGEFECALVGVSHTASRTVSDILVTRQGQPVVELRGVEMYAVPSGTA